MATNPGAGNLQSVLRTMTRPLVTRLWKLELTGFEQLEAAGPAILCPNHISFIDSMFLSCLVPRNISFVGKAEYMDSWKTRNIFPALGMIPIDRGGGLFELRVSLATRRIARVIVCIHDGELHALHGFLKKTRLRGGRRM